MQRSSMGYVLRERMGALSHGHGPGELERVGATRS